MQQLVSILFTPPHAGARRFGAGCVSAKAFAPGIH